MCVCLIYRTKPRPLIRRSISGRNIWCQGGSGCLLGIRYFPSLVFLLGGKHFADMTFFFYAIGEIRRFISSLGMLGDSGWESGDGMRDLEGSLGVGLGWVVDLTIYIFCVLTCVVFPASRHKHTFCV